MPLLNFLKRNRNMNKKESGTWKCLDCGEIFKTRKELKQHKKEMNHHKRKDAGIYICKCGKIFNEPHAYSSHCSRCKIHLGHDPKKHQRSDAKGNWKCEYCNQVFRTKADLKEHKHQVHDANNKKGTHGKYPYKLCFCQYCKAEFHNKIGLTNHEKFCKLNPNRKEQTIEEKQRISNGVKKSMTPELRQHLSEVRKQKIASGEIKISNKSGYGLNCSLIYNDNKYKLRSSYEFIYALWLCYNNINFKYEDITLPAIRKNEFANTFTCDFHIGNKIIELKGRKSEKDKLLKETFEYHKYFFIELFYDKVILIKEKLLQKYNLDINHLLKLAALCKKNKEEFTYNFNTKEEIISEKITKIQKEQITSNKNKKVKYKVNTEEEWSKRKDLILQSNVDLSKYGYLEKLIKITGLTKKKIQNTIKYYNLKVYKRKSGGIE